MVMAKRKSCFKAGSAVEISINGGSSWFSGIVIRRTASKRFLVEYNNLFADEQSHKPLRKSVILHQLRPLLPPESYYPKFKSGDKVDAFHNNGWCEGHITKELANGRFGVNLGESPNEMMMVFRKEQLRTHREWIDHSWIFSSIGDHNRDRISELDDNVLLHIMSFMDTKDAVRTCVLSKRWENISKHLTNIRFSTLHKYSRGLKTCKKFVSWILSCRDDSHSLFGLAIESWIGTDVNDVDVLLDMVMEYAMSHKVQQLTIGKGYKGSLYSLSSIFCCPSLTSLKLCFAWNPFIEKLPKSLHLPVLKSLHLENFIFTVDDNGCAEPFSNCPMLDTLFLGHRYFYRDTFLRISNSTLSSLTIHQERSNEKKCYKIVLSTPNLKSYTVNGLYGHKVISTCNLSFIEEVNVDILGGTSSMILSCLQVFAANVKILKLTSRTLHRILLEYILDPSPFRLQPPPLPPHFDRLELLKVENKRLIISEEGLNKGVRYLLQNSFKIRVDIFYLGKSRELLY